MVGRAATAPCEAQRAAAVRARRPKVCLLSRHQRLCQVVREKLQRCWSPEQISGYLVRAFPDDKSMRVAPETIYRSLFIQARGVLKKQLLAQLRTGRSMRRARGVSARVSAAKGAILEALCIRERPAEVEDRAVPGNWEGDLLIGSRHSQMATLVERHTRFVMLVRVASKDSASVVQALAQQMGKLPQELRGSLTWDRGSEMAEHKSFTVATDLKVYFCDPASPWQRGSNENTNGLLRQYFPKGTDLAGYSQAQLNAVARRLNQRPRKTLGFASPAEKLNELLH
jgi:IS30 family transposase